jgi:hypothetical protein
VRFLTVPETIPRRDQISWANDWCRRALNVRQQEEKLGIPMEELLLLHNEGSLLLYRLGSPHVARLRCSAALRLRRESGSWVPKTFMIQQWVNLARLDASAMRVHGCERRLKLLLEILDRPSLGLSPDELLKAKVICFVEQAALILKQQDLTVLYKSLNRLSSDVCRAVKPCAVETEIRCLIQRGDNRLATDRVYENLSACEGLPFVGLLVLLSGLRPLSQKELRLLIEGLKEQLELRPIHAVQVGEFLLRNSRDENRLELMMLRGPFYSTSMAVEDAIAADYFTQLPSHIDDVHPGVRMNCNTHKDEPKPEGIRDPLVAVAKVLEELRLILKKCIC